MDNSYNELRESFAEIFPEYAARMEAAATDEEAWKTYEEIVQEARQQYAQVLKKNGLTEPSDRALSSFSITESEYQNLVNAKGDKIRQYVMATLNTHKILQQYKDDAEEIAAQMYVAQIDGITEKGILASQAALLEGVGEADAVLAGVVACTAEVIIAASFVIVVSILIPILYFMLKEARGLILLINDLEEKITYQSNYFLHGDVVDLTVQELPPKFVMSGKGRYSAGYFSGSKEGMALIGVQGAFTIENEAKRKFTFGFDCPLSSMYVDNNCYCAINETAEKVAELTDENNAQEWRAEKDGYGIHIKCNSKGGSVAYYIARIYKT